MLRPSGTPQRATGSAGLPRTIVSGGTEVVTTLPAVITAPSPTVTWGSSSEPGPMKTSSPIRTEGIALVGDLALLVGDDRRPHAEVDPVADLDQVGEGGLDDHVGADEAARADLDPAQPVQAHPGGLGTGPVEGEHRQQPALGAGQGRLVPHAAGLPLRLGGDVGGERLEHGDLLGVHLFEVDLDAQLLLELDDDLDEAERVDHAAAAQVEVAGRVGGVDAEVSQGRAAGLEDQAPHAGRVIAHRSMR